MTDPLIAASNTFEAFLPDESLLNALTKLNISVPTDVQRLSIPIALKGSDLIVQAQTGSGKTLAFVLPILKRLADTTAGRNTRALIITPTRELAVQVKTVIESLDMGISPACIIGGASARAQEKQLSRDARIVVGTPGRIMDFLNRRLIQLRKCDTFVLDEADEMLSMGFIDEVRDILKKLPPVRQGLFFSATITDRVLGLANIFLKKPETVSVAPIDSGGVIEHLFVSVDGGVATKANRLCDVINFLAPDSAIIFCNTKSDTELVEAVLRRRGFDASRINSDLSQKERERVLSGLKAGTLRFLIATDVAARGIDVKELGLVVNYTMPPEPEVYVHRTGRTGRAGADGKAVSIIGPQDKTAFFLLKQRLGIVVNELTLPPQSTSKSEQAA